jgi:hypothetical protein
VEHGDGAGALGGEGFEVSAPGADLIGADEGDQFIDGDAVLLSDGEGCGDAVDVVVEDAVLELLVLEDAARNGRARAGREGLGDEGTGIGLAERGGHGISP